MSRTVFDNIKSQVAVRPIAASAVQTSAAIDTKGYGNLMVSVENGAATGTPSSYTVNAKIQHATASGGSYADITDANIVEITADDKSAQIQLLGLGTTIRRYLKILVTPAMTGGSSPKALISAVVLLGQAHNKPVGNSDTGA